MVLPAHRFRAELEWTGAASGPTRDLRSYSREFEIRMEGKPSIAGSAAPAYRGDASRQNPEELFLASLASCQLLTYLGLAAQAKLEIVSYADACEAFLGEEDGRWRVTRVVLRPRIRLAPGSDTARALELVSAAHEGCFVARSVSCEVSIEPEVSAG